MFGEHTAGGRRVRREFVSVRGADAQFTAQRITRVGGADIGELALAAREQHCGKVGCRARAQTQARRLPTSIPSDGGSRELSPTSPPMNSAADATTLCSTRCPERGDSA